MTKKQPYEGFHPYTILRDENGNTDYGLAMPLPSPDQSKHYKLGEHRLVQVIYGADPDDTDRDMEHGPYWQCFDHGPACWATNAARNATGQPLIAKCLTCGAWLTHAERAALSWESPIDLVKHGEPEHAVMPMRVDDCDQ